MPNICLCMIVKNESRVIQRCLKSVLPVVDSMFIVDTGSSDGTQDIIKNFFAENSVDGYVVDRPWVNFSHNRNEAIKLAKSYCMDADYLYFIDADEELVIDDGGLFWKDITLDAYTIDYHYGDLIYPRNSLVTTKQPWRYEGVLHEYLKLDTPFTYGGLNNCHVHVRPEGARSSDPEKFQKDALILREALLSDPNNDRYQFYLAQSLRDAGQLNASIQEYKRRADMGGWDQEVWYSYYQMAKLAEDLNTIEQIYSPETIIEWYIRAINYRPKRAEVYGRLARYLRLREYYAVACMFAEKGMLLGTPDDSLFIERSYYEWICKDEFAVSAYWCGRVQEAFNVTIELLEDPRIPGGERPRLEANLEFCQERLTR